jgi:hypothetical protein
LRTPDRSAGRFPDGHDTDSNCNDFQIQASTVLSTASAAGATNVKVTNVSDFRAGQSVIIDSGTNRETAVIATVGTAGGTTVSNATAPGATVIPVAGTVGFGPGQTITIGSGASQETAVIVAATGPGRGGPGRGGAGATITVAALKNAHAAGTQVAGSGITLAAPLTRAHANGVQLTSDLPTPGAPNRYPSRAAR